MCTSGAQTGIRKIIIKYPKEIILRARLKEPHVSSAAEAGFMIERASGFPTGKKETRISGMAISGSGCVGLVIKDKKSIGMQSG